jgi:hypothetical protein
MRYILYPLIGILKIGAATFDTLPTNREAGALLSGFTVSALIGTIYLAPILFVTRRLSRTRRLFEMLERICPFVVLGAILVAGLGEALSLGLLMIVATAAVVLTVLLTSAVLMSRVIQILAWQLLPTTRHTS